MVYSTNEEEMGKLALFFNCLFKQLLLSISLPFKRKEEPGTRGSRL
jgi:hypothetical protein